MLKEVSWKDMLNMASNINISIMETLGRLYALWLREFKVFLREHSRLIAATFTPLLWLFVIGSGFGSALHPSLTTNIDYQKFIFPGIINMSIIFSSVFFGSYIIWDRKFDFLKSVMVAPVSRDTIFIGKTLGGMSNSLGTSSNTFGYRRTTRNSLQCTFSSSDYRNCITAIFLFNIIGSSYRAAILKA